MSQIKEIFATTNNETPAIEREIISDRSRQWLKLTKKIKEMKTQTVNNETPSIEETVYKNVLTHLIRRLEEVRDFTSVPPNEALTTNARIRNARNEAVINTTKIFNEFIQRNIK